MSHVDVVDYSDVSREKEKKIAKVVLKNFKKNKTNEPTLGKKNPSATVKTKNKEGKNKR